MMLRKIRGIFIYTFLILFVTAALAGQPAVQVKASTGSQAPEKMNKVYETKDLELYIDMSSTRFAVREKNSGIIWYGTPPDYNQDSIANKTYKEIMSSNILLTYIDDTGEKILSSFTNAVAFEQFNVEIIENGVRIEYLISEKALDEMVIPFVMPYSYMQERILPHLDENEQNEMLLNYSKLSVKDEIIKNYVKRHRIKQYPFIVEEDIYVLIPSRRSALNKEIIHSHLEKAGITKEEIIELNQKYYDHTSIEKNPSFNIALNLTMDEYGLKAEVNMAEIEYDSFDAELRSITLLPYFGAAGLNSEGYVLIPDGSGAIIRLNNKKEMFGPITIPVYGGNDLDVTVKSTTIRQPVGIAAFGIAYDKKGYAAVISNGDAIASITAGLSGNNTSYNYVCAKFNYNDYYMLENPMNLSSNPQMSKNPYKDKVSVMYMFLGNNKANYSGMAEKVREYYENIGVLKERTKKTQAPLSIEIPGAVPVTKRFLGITYNGYDSLTKFTDAKRIIDTLYEAGIEHMNIRLTGWTEGGLFQKYPSNLKPINTLGSRASFNSLVKRAQELEYDLYLDASLTKIYCGIVTALFKSVRDIKGSPWAVRNYSHVTQSPDDMQPAAYLLRPDEWEDELINTQKKISKLGINNVSLADFGYTLYPDYRKKGYNRQDTLKIINNSLNSINNNDANLMGLYGNVITADSFDIITDIPLYDSDYVVSTEEVPFLQMILRGYVDYYGTPVNKNDNSIKHVLRSIEYGASGIKYLLTNADNTRVWELDQNEYRNTFYKDYISEISRCYGLIKDFSRITSGQKIIEHKKEFDNVFSTLYESGVKVYVNYNNRPITVDGLEINGLDFIITEG